MIQNYLDYSNEHECYITIMEEYSNTELFKEIILFLDSAFPIWKTNEGLGFYAAELVLDIFEENDYLDFEKNYNKTKFIKLYLEVEQRYHDLKSWNRLNLLDTIDKKVEGLYEEEFLELVEDSSVSSADYLAYCKAAKEKFTKSFMNEIPYNFINKII